MKNYLLRHSAGLLKACLVVWLLQAMINPAYAQQINVKGIVTDVKEGNALPGVTVSVKGTAKGTSTDATGTYQLSAAPGAILVFSYIGYKTQELKAGGTTLNVQLEADNTSLNEVVVVAYGSQEKKDLTGSVTSLPAKSVQDLPVTSIDQKLAGQVAGVQVSNITGTPGGGTAIKIRGSGSIGAGDQPLFVVDGFALSNSFGQIANPLSFLNSDDIESITVLKDASSTAIYGSRGANGVVLINTKKGNSKAPVVNFNMYYGLQQTPNKGRPQMLNAREFAQYRKDIIFDEFASRGQVPTDADIPEEYRNPEQYGEGTNWYNEILRVAPQQNYHVSVSTGNENYKGFFSLGYLKQDGTVRYTGYERVTGRANVEANIGSKIKIGVNIAPSFSNQITNYFESDFVDVVTRSLWLSPLVPKYDKNGNLTQYVKSPGMYEAPNPLISLRDAPTKGKSIRALATSFIEYEITKGLKFKYSLGADYANFSSFTYNPTSVGGANTPPPVRANSATGRSYSFNWLSEALLSYDKSFGKNHRMSALVGYTAQKELYDGININVENYPDDIAQTINNATIVSGWGQAVQEWSLLSYLARLNYTFKDRYLFTATFRSDGSSRFGPNNKYGYFPSGAFAWRVSQEDFMKGISWIDDMKLRVSYGLSGNNNIGNYTFLPLAVKSNYVFGGQLASGKGRSSLQNYDLTWEESSQWDAGIDLALFKSRVNIVLDYYRRITRSMLYVSEIPQSSGFASTTINSGEVLNRGVELGITSQNTTGAFEWNTNFNIAFNRNKVLALNENNDPIFSGRSGEGSFTHKTEVGKPLGQFYGYVIEGVYKDQADLDKSPKHVTSVVGSIKYKDIDGNGVIEAVKDFEVIGNAQPDFIWGLTNDFKFKRFDLSILINGSQGGQVLKTANQYLNNIDGIFNVDRRVLNRWRSPEQPGDGRTPTTNGARVIYRDINSDWVEDASFVSIRNITLGYTFPEKLLGKTRFIRSTRIYGGVQNAFMFTPYSGANPEVSRNGSTVLTPGMDFTNYPVARVYTLGANFSF